eukprot:5602758-Pyramimonas_sp.AAC.1
MMSSLSSSSSSSVGRCWGPRAPPETKRGARSRSSSVLRRPTRGAAEGGGGLWGRRDTEDLYIMCSAVLATN